MYLSPLICAVKSKAIPLPTPRWWFTEYEKGTDVVRVHACYSNTQPTLSL
jgi:hypothetical protein